MGQLRLLVGTMLLLSGLAAASCAADDDGAAADDAKSTTTTRQTSDGAPSTKATPTTAKRTGIECLDATTTTTSKGLPSVCQLIDEIPSDELPPEGARDYVGWTGVISGSIQTPGCEAVSQSGEIILVVFANGDLSGAGETVSGGYRCDNGASIPAMTNSYGIDGRLTNIFTLTFTDDVQLSSGPIEGGRARIVQDTGFGLVTIELTCQNC